MIATAALCLALNMHFEAANQTEHGRVAVAHVTISRSETSGKNICHVVAKPKQFSWVGVKMERKVLENGDFSLKIDEKRLPTGKKWRKTLVLARNLLKNRPKMPKMSHFHATYVAPKWAKKMQFVAQIGDHLFYFEEKRA